VILKHLCVFYKLYDCFFRDFKTPAIYAVINNRLANIADTKKLNSPPVSISLILIFEYFINGTTTNASLINIIVNTVKEISIDFVQLISFISTVNRTAFKIINKIICVPKGNDRNLCNPRNNNMPDA